MPTVAVNLSTDHYVKVNRGLNTMLIEAHRDAVRIVFGDLQPVRGNSVFHLLQRRDGALEVPYSNTDMWALAMTYNSSLVVTELIDSSVDQTNAYDELKVSMHTPEVQISPQYNNLDKVRTFDTLTGVVGVTNGEYFASTGSSPNSIGAIFSERQLISRPGQGSLFRFQARFPDVGEASELRAGPSTALDSLSFGYNAGEFCIGYEHGGAVVIEELTIDNTPSGSESATVTINGAVYTVPLTSGDLQHTALEVAVSLSSQVPFYNFTQNDNTVVCRSIIAAPVSGAFAFTSSTAQGTWVNVNPGKVVVENYVKQSEWNVNRMPGLIPANINQYQIQISGDIKYFVKDERSHRYTLVHIIKLSNNTTESMFSIRAFRMACVVNNKTDTVDSRVYMGEASAFNEGVRVLLEPSRAGVNTQSDVGTTQKNVISLRCAEVYGDKVNMGRVQLLGVTATNEANKKTAVLKVCKGVTFTGGTDFRYVDKAGSIVETCDSDVAVEGGTCLASITVAPRGSIHLNMESLGDILLPGEVITMSMGIISGGSSGDMTVAPVWKEDK